MTLQQRRFLSLGLLVVFLLAILSTPALAKDKEEKLPPYDVDGMDQGKMWVPWVFAFLFAGGCIAVAFKNPHRSAIERT
jgi:hypothetical protein